MLLDLEQLALCLELHCRGVIGDVEAPQRIAYPLANPAHRITLSSRARHEVVDSLAFAQIVFVFTQNRPPPCNRLQQIIS